MKLVILFVISFCLILKVSSNQTQLEEGDTSEKSVISKSIAGGISNSSDSTPSSRQRLYFSFPRPRPHKNIKNKNLKNQKNKNQKNKNKNKNQKNKNKSTKTPSISQTTPVTPADVQEYDEDDLVQAQFFFGKK